MKKLRLKKPSNKSVDGSQVKTQIYFMAKNMLFPLYLVYKVIMYEQNVSGENKLPYLKKVNDHCFQLFNFPNARELILAQYLLKI